MSQDSRNNNKKQNDENKIEEKKKEIKEEIPVKIKCIFEGVFIESKNEDILEKYNSVIAMFKKKCQVDKSIVIEDKDIEWIFTIFGDIKIKSYEVKESFIYYQIELTYDHENLEKYNIYQLKKTKYHFLYNNTYYFCLILESMKSYLEELLKNADFYFEISYFPHGKNIIKDISQFMMLNPEDFKIMIDYQFRDIDYNQIDDKSIYIEEKIITGEQLNLKLGHYVNITEEDYKAYKYYDTKERKNFYENLDSILNIRKIIGICGPYGSGKTISLLKYIISDKKKKCFYVNLATIKKLSLVELKKLLKYEMIKLFSKKLIFPDNFPLNKNLKETCDKCLALIDNSERINAFKLIKSIIELIKNNNGFETYFIIDQYSSKYDIDKKEIQDLLNINIPNNIHIIICSSMNNSSVKNDLCECLSEKLIFPKFGIDNIMIFYLYTGSLFRLNYVDNYSDIIKDESPNLKAYLNYFGNLPLYYYSLKKAEQQRVEFYSYIKQEKENITEEIKNFYQSNVNNKIKVEYQEQMFLDIIDIILYINKKKIFFFDDLSITLAKLPLKFLEIKIEKISINDLKLYGLITEDEKISNFIKSLENDGLKQNVVINMEKYLDNYTRLMNEEMFCQKFISKVTEKEKKKLNYKKTNFDESVSIFYLDYLFPLMEDIFSNMIYNILEKSSIYFFSLLSSQTQGGLLEMMINEHIKNKKRCLTHIIDCYEIIDTFVPNEFFIQNFISRKTDTIRTFIENKYIKNSGKKKLPPNKTIYITQLQFTGKYYDCALLIPKKEPKNYIIFLFQISKKKKNHQHFFRGEHEIIMNRVKTKIEREYDINIVEAHFAYILTYESQDTNTMDFCEKNSLKYYLFNVEKLSFENDISSINSLTFITKDFHCHNSFSILPKTKFKIEKNELSEKGYIGKIQNNLKFENIEQDLYKLLNKNYPVIYDLPENDKNEFNIYGHFKKLFNVNNSFCIWFSNKDLSFYRFKKEDQSYYKTTIKYGKKLSDKEFTLICSKYRINKKIIK